jgi:hypothetical protein
VIGTVVLLDFLDAYPGDAAHGLAFDLDHRLGDLGDQFLFLLGSEDVFDDVDRY